MRQGMHLRRSASVRGGAAAAHAPSIVAYPLLRAMLRTMLLLLMAASVVYWLICAFGAITAHDLGNDFLVYFSAALALRYNPHADIFDLHTLQVVAAAHGVPMPTLLYLYPPLLAILLIPLTLLPYRVALFAWTLFSLALWVYGTAILVQWAWQILDVTPSSTHTAAGHEGDASAEERGARRTRQDLALFACTVTVLLSASFFPLLYGIINGQVTSLIFILTLLALALLRRHPRLAGATLALATWIKLYPVILIGYFLLRRRWRVVEGAALAGGLLAVMAGLVVGWPGLLASTSIIANGSAMAYAPHASWNLSLALMPLWIALALGGEPSHALTLLGSAIALAVGVAFAASVVVSRRNSTMKESTASATRPIALGTRQTQTQLPDVLGFCWGLCTMVLLSPVTWMHTYAWLLPPSIICLSVMLRTAIVKRQRGDGDTLAMRITRVRVEVAGLLVVLVAYASLAVPAYTQQQPNFSILLHERPLNLPLLLLHPIGALLLWSVNGLLFLRASRDTAQVAAMNAAERVDGVDEGQDRLMDAIRPTHPSARFLALALMALLVMVGAIEMLYWSIFVVVSSR